MQQFVQNLMLTMFVGIFVLMIAVIIAAAIIIPILVKKHKGKITGFVKTAFADTTRKFNDMNK